MHRFQQIPYRVELQPGKKSSEEGQRVYARAGATPAHPKVEPVERVRPANVYMLGQDDVKEFPKYEKIWKEIFQIR